MKDKVLSVEWSSKLVEKNIHIGDSFYCWIDNSARPDFPAADYKGDWILCGGNDFVEYVKDWSSKKDVQSKVIIPAPLPCELDLEIGKNSYWIYKNAGKHIVKLFSDIEFEGDNLAEVLARALIYLKEHNFLNLED